MPPGNIFAVAERYKAELLRGERAAASRLVREYGKIWIEIQGQIQALLEAYEKRPLVIAGQQDYAWFYEMQRMQKLKKQVAVEMARYAALADTETQRMQRLAIEYGIKHAGGLLNAVHNGVGFTFDKLNRRALEQQVGFLASGSPLAKVFARFGETAAQGLEERLIRAVALGLSPRQAAREAKKAFGAPLGETLRIMRTEVMRTYRESTRSAWASGGIVGDWIWNASFSARTCPGCWAMHGTRHSVEETLEDHPNGRCSMIPIVVLDGVEYPQGFETGAERFARAGDDMQRAVLGPAGKMAFDDGKITLDNLVGWRESPDWGRSLSVNSLKSVIGEKEAAGYTQVAILKGKSKDTEQSN